MTHPDSGRTGNEYNEDAAGPVPAADQGREVSREMEAGPDRLDGAVIRLALVVLAGAVMVQLDATIVSVALDTLGDAFDIGYATTQWVGTAYLLALAMAVPLAGWSVDRFGTRRMWLVSLVAFGAGSALCGVAWSAQSLIAFRVVQGIGGGLLLPLMQTILAQAAGPERLGRLMSVVAIPALVTPVFGPVLGGLIVDALDWRWIFFVNVPVCAVAVALAARALPDLHTPSRQRLDVLGVALLSPGLALTVYGLSEAGSRGGFGAAGVLVPAGVGLVLLALFGLHATHTRAVPVIDLRLFRARGFSASAVLMLLSGVSVMGAMFLLPLYEQQVRGHSAAGAGLLLAPQGLGMMVAMPLVGRLSDRGAARPLVVAGLLLAIAGSVPLARIGADTSDVLVSLALAVRGAGVATAMVPAMSAAYTGLRRDEIPRATSAVRIFQQIGGSLGVAVLAVVLARGSAAPVLAGAFADAFWWSLVCCVVALPAAFLLPGSGRRGAGQPGDPGQLGHPGEQPGQEERVAMQ
ncbi:multidrug efflux MFS transporter [Frankia sp. Mgl5]|uniref:MDR family MFS transporter n=1 Tax=Frankia sp. Mgl5 TaxID=2933793 RepID=UPI00200CABEF|nr:MDR family MFS transporter [Frankia sp. Mgl5]MCK9931933.1 multidrug efflux MFS transporter [Frankia sp. Mgl5]